MKCSKDCKKSIKWNLKSVCCKCLDLKISLVKNKTNMKCILAVYSMKHKSRTRKEWKKHLKYNKKRREKNLKIG